MNMAQETKTAVVMSWNIVNRLRLGHSDKMYLANKIQEAIDLKVAEQKKKNAEIVRNIKQMKVHQMFQGLDNPFLDIGSKPDKDGWTNLSKQVLQVLDQAATAIERGE